MLTMFLRHLTSSTALLVATLGLTRAASAAEWQWSVPDGSARVYLWIPPNCAHVRGVVVGNHNMLEQDIFERLVMRETLTKLGFAEAWAVPGLGNIFDIDKGDVGRRIEGALDRLADESGYAELKTAPIVALGHSANATWPWSFAAWKPQRTLAVLSIKGDAPQTNLAGYGKPATPWGDRTIDGIPGLMVMGEYEWWEDRLTPLLDFRRRHPEATVAFLCDAGSSHFGSSDALVEFLAMFVRKAAEARLPVEPATGDAAPELRPVDVEQGWLVDRWHPNQAPTAAPALYASYAGDRSTALWAFDQEMADATEAHYRTSFGKKPQFIGVMQAGQIIYRKPTQEQVRPDFAPAADGMTFSLDGVLLDAWPDAPAKEATQPTTLPTIVPGDGAAVRFTRIMGPVAQIGPNVFRLQFGRAEFTENGRNNDLWLLAYHPGNAAFKPAVQQLKVRAEPNTTGKPQFISFPAIVDVTTGVRSLTLTATSDAGLPVQYYVREGPAEVDGNTLALSTVPPRAKFPVKVTVVAWQWGTPGPNGVQSAKPVVVSFSIRRSDKPHE
ncbi:MAG: hypothetical protein QM770_14410 [Tepidisphaeraceae bacterium]